MKPYEISIWEDRLQQREDLKYINVYPGLNTDLKDLSFWFYEISEYNFDRVIKDNYWNNITLHSWDARRTVSEKQLYAKGFATGISYITPGKDYTLVFELKNFLVNDTDSLVPGYPGASNHPYLTATSGDLIQINAGGTQNSFTDNFYITWDVDAAAPVLGYRTTTNANNYRVYQKDNDIVVILRLTSKNNFITPAVRVGLYTRLLSLPAELNKKNPYWQADIREALYEGHEIFSDIWNNSEATYNDFYNLETNPDGDYQEYFSGEKEYFKEYKLATIGSEKMQAPYRAISPIFTQNTNGTSSLSFSMYSKYYDQDSEMLQENPFIKYMVNERKIKLKYKNEWHDFVIKSISESSEDYKFDYVAKDLFINELSKIGFNKTFQTELLNNTGTIIELGNEVLSGTDWEVNEENSDLLFQTTEDVLYQATLNFEITAIKYQKTDSGINKISTTIPANSNIMIFYNSISSQGSNLYFLYADENYITNMDNIISNADFYLLEGVTYKDSSSYPFFNNSQLINSLTLDIDRRGEMYISETEQIYYAPLDRYVNIYVNENGEERYGYIESEYETTPVVNNLITNSKNFTDTTGWNTSNGLYSNQDFVKDAKIILNVHTLSDNSKKSGLSFQIGTNNYAGQTSGHLFNTGFSDNISFVKELKQGDEYVLRLTTDMDENSYHLLHNINPIIAEYNKTNITSDPNLGSNKYFPYGDYENNPDFLIQFSKHPNAQISGTTKAFNTTMYDPNNLVPIYCPFESLVCYNTAVYYFNDYSLDTGETFPLFYTYKATAKYWVNNLDWIEDASGGNTGESFVITDEGLKQWANITGYNSTYGRGSLGSEGKMTDKDIVIGCIMESLGGINYNFLYYQYYPDYSGVTQGEQEFYKYSNGKWYLTQNKNDTTFTNCPIIPDEDILTVLKARNVWKVIEWQTSSVYSEDTDSSVTEKVAITTLEAIGTYEGPDLKYSDLLTKNIGLFLQDNSTVSNNSRLLIIDAQLYKAYYDSDGNIYTPQDVPGDNTRKIYRYFDPSSDENVEITEVTDATPLIYEYEGYTASSNYTKVINENCIKKNSITATESNCYNLIQKLCETFECWARFNIEHNDNGEIKLNEDYRPIKNISFKEYVGDNNYAGFKYGINLNSIKRTLDSEQFVSKIIVKNNSNEYGKDGFCSIARAENNPIGENYLFDFSYYINQGLLDKEKTLKDLYEDYYSLLCIRKLQSEQYIEERKRLSVLVSNLEALYETYTLAVENTESLLADAKDRFSQLTGYSYSYYIGVLGSKDSEWDNNSTFIDYKTKIIYYTQLLAGFESLVKSSKNDYTEALNDYQEVIWSIERIALEKEKLHSSFYKRYSSYIQEGSWISEDYMDDDKYYFDALKTLQTSAMPKVSYTINVADISSAEDFENYEFNIGDKTYIEDTEFFGWEYIDNVKTPYKEEVIVSEISYSLDEPENTQIKVQNYKTQFEDLFQRMAATIQAVQYGTGKYSNTQTALSSGNRFDKLDNQVSKLQAQLKFLT